MPESRDYWNKLRNMKDQALTKNLRILIDALKAENVTRVVMSYYGGGDSGDYHFPIFTVKAEDGTTKDLEGREGYGGSSYKFDSCGQFESDTEVVLTHVCTGKWDQETETFGEPHSEDKTKTLITAVYEMMEQVVDLEHDGWYNNDGAEGTVVIDTDEETINVEHGAYYTSTEWHEYSFKAGDA